MYRKTRVLVFKGWGSIWPKTFWNIVNSAKCLMYYVQEEQFFFLNGFKYLTIAYGEKVFYKNLKLNVSKATLSSKLQSFITKNLQFLSQACFYIYMISTHKVFLCKHHSNEKCINWFLLLYCNSEKYMKFNYWLLQLIKPLSP